jgi:hypothetical protein
MIGLTICLYVLVTAQTPLAEIIAIGLALGFFNSLQFSSMNSMAYADIETHESSMASTIASSFQQISMSFGLAFGSLVAAWYLGDLPQSDRGLQIEPVKAPHVARRVDAVKLHGVHGVNLEIVQRLTL